MSRYAWILMLVALPLFAQNFQIVEVGPIHEAYITPVQGEIILDAVAKAPPSPIDEQMPERTDSLTVWVPGYWAYVPVREDFVWVSGVWRRPPPRHQWIHGYWKHLDEGWVYISGFWSKGELDQVNFIKEAPPSAKAEDVEDPNGDDYFWIPGYWSYEGGKYEWLEGRWNTLSEDWVFVPSHYVWRPGGYVFVPGYWDWPLDEVGEAYANVVGDGGTYIPEKVLEIETIIEQCFVCYPNYLCYYHHHYHFHMDWWHSWCCVPPWWDWFGWWSLSWSNQWGLFWWWGHSGWPQPMWLDGALAQQIAPPSRLLAAFLRNAMPPAIITPRGLVSADAILEARHSVLGKDVKMRPILPASSSDLDDIFDDAERTIDQPRRVLKPTGSDDQRQLPRPDTGGKPSRGGRVSSPPGKPHKPMAQPRRTRKVEPAPQEPSIRGRTEKRPRREVELSPPRARRYEPAPPREMAPPPRQRRREHVPPADATRPQRRVAPSRPYREAPRDTTRPAPVKPTKPAPSSTDPSNFY